jgi:glycosyltransferase involved in cell wall biosynthesis
VNRQRALPGISVFLLAHNEADNIERAVRGFLAVLPELAGEYEVIVVDDGSTDSTGQIVGRLCAEDSRVRTVRHPVNRGYGAAVRSGIGAAALEYVLLCDGDGQFDPRDLARLAERMPACDVVVGRRANRADPLMRRLNGYAWTALMRLMFGLRTSDVDCGFKLFKRELLDGLELRATGAMISTELMARLAGRGARIAEVDVRHLPRLAGQSSGASLKVIARAFRELAALYRELRAERRRAS